MLVRKNVSLKPFNTFGVESIADELIEIANQNEISDYLNSDSKSNNLLLLGGGSNILLTKNFEGTVIRYLGNEFNIIKEDKLHVWIKGGAGLNWHQFVLKTIQMGFQGLENLSLIPGNLGAAPIQNIGAYGVEIKDFLESVNGIEISTGLLQQFNNQECNFEYRDSIFKKELKDKIAIISVTVRLNKIPSYNVSYKDVKERIKEKNIKSLSAETISSIIIEIRKKKLPDPNIIGNAGSFFKNPFVSTEELKSLNHFFPEMPSYPYKEGILKISAAWLIEQCGWKGIIKSNVGTYINQPLVLVNYGKATGNEIYRFAKEIQSSVMKKFGIQLEPEINII